MITRVVFDFGQVLVRFDPHAMCARYLDRDEDIAVMERVLFDRLYWDELDAGTMTDEQAVALATERLPAPLKEKAAEIFYHWIYMLPEIDGMRALLEELSAGGMPLYLLSNISRYFADHSHEIPVLSFFDHCIFSAVCGKTKPHRDIFEHLCDVCGAAPQELLFIDDSDVNVRGAEAAGIRAYRFDGDVAALRAYLVESGVLKH